MIFKRCRRQCLSVRLTLHYVLVPPVIYLLVEPHCLKHNWSYRRHENELATCLSLEIKFESLYDSDARYMYYKWKIRRGRKVDSPSTMASMNVIAFRIVATFRSIMLHMLLIKVYGTCCFDSQIDCGNRFA